MASFDETISANRRDSAVILVLLALLVGVVGAAAAFVMFGGDCVWETSAACVALTSAYFCVAWFYGDSMVLASSRAIPVERRNYPVLNNVLEELCVATGLPMPAVYVIEDAGMNAFATGRDPEHASVAITSGLLEKLDRDELLSVMAHEMTHVENYDIRFSTLLAVTVGAVLIVRDIAFNSFRFGVRRRRGFSDGGRAGLALWPIYIACLLFILLSPLFALLLQTMASRSREYMADTGAVKITRNPQAMISALTKISQGVSSLLHSANSGTQHIFFANPQKVFGRERSSIFSTHPLISERIVSIKKIYGIR